MPGTIFIPAKTAIKTLREADVGTNTSQATHSLSAVLILSEVWVGNDL